MNKTLKKTSNVHSLHLLLHFSVHLHDDDKISHSQSNPSRMVKIVIEHEFLCHKLCLGVIKLKRE